MTTLIERLTKTVGILRHRKLNTHAGWVEEAIKELSLPTTILKEPVGPRLLRSDIPSDSEEYEL